MENNMLGWIAAGVVGGAILGAVGTRQVMRSQVETAEARRDLAEEQADARIAEATRDTVDAAGKNTTGAIDAALAPANKDADTRAEVAAMPATQLAMVAALKPDVPPWTLALAGYSLCISGAQGKGEGSAAFGCTKRGERLDEAIAARIAHLAIEERKQALNDREASLDALERGLGERREALDRREAEGCPETVAPL